MKGGLLNFICRHDSVAKFLIVGVIASGVHGAISWLFYYHIWDGRTILSTLMGYTGGWLLSYLGNRLWSFRSQTKETAVVKSASKFVLCQLVAVGVLLISTWLVQQLIILYFWWYIITNNLLFEGELKQFSEGASYPPALFSGMLFAACCSYLIMRKYVFVPESK